MAKLPTVAIVGRPNVGKSTLFNRLVGRRLALVDDRPGVTRDRREGEAHLLGLDFRVIDTAGYEDEDPDTLPGRMRAQTSAAVREADVALFLIDARAGVVPLDQEIGRWLRSETTPVVIAANKSEGRAGDAGLYEAFSLGFGEPIAISAEHGEGVADLFEQLQPHLDADEVDEEEGRRRGAQPQARHCRASECRQIDADQPHLQQDRLITGPEAGITRDSIAIDWEWQGRPVRLIDTAGMRKKAKVDDKLEKLSVADARRAVDFAEVVVLLLDATRGLEAQDLRIADHVLQEGRALLIAISKWDVAEGGSGLFNGIRAALEEGLSQARGVPLLTVSGVTGKGIDQLLAACLRSARNLVQARFHRPAQSLVRGGSGEKSAARARRQADQAALHHPGRHAPTDLCAVRHAHRRIAGHLSTLSGERHPQGARVRRSPGPPERARLEEPVRHQDVTPDR
jgi:GTP-binding protein